MYNEYTVFVEEVRSGDDLMLLVDLGTDNLFKRVRARLSGVDTPDAYKEGPDTDAGKIREEVRMLTRTKCEILVFSKNNASWIVELFLTDKEKSRTSLNQWLISKGYVYSRPVIAAVA